MKPLIESFAGGLLPFRLGDDEHFCLVIKAQKEAILAARMNGGLSFYLPILPSSTIVTTALITAFFDDCDEPLTIRSPLFSNDPSSDAILDILSYDEVDIYFFDEHDYEWMSFKAALEKSGVSPIALKKIGLLSYHPETAKSIHRVLISWFGQRTAEDDKRAIQAVFKDALAPDDIFVLDMTPEVNDYQGSSGFRHDTLIRNNPGYFQERDIATCLLRSFNAQEILMNLKRKDNFKEILDHLVLTDDVAILIQAKDSPTTEEGISRTMKRKRLSTQSQIAAAIRQINGAARYLERESVAKLIVGGQEIEIAIGERHVIGLVIVKELFEDEGESYATACSKFSRLNTGGLIMDYGSFHALTHQFNSADAFVGALRMFINQVRTSGWVSVKDAVSDSLLDWIEGVRDAKPNVP